MEKSGDSMALQQVTVSTRPGIVLQYKALVLQHFSIYFNILLICPIGSEKLVGINFFLQPSVHLKKQKKVKRSSLDWTLYSCFKTSKFCPCHCFNEGFSVADMDFNFVLCATKFCFLVRSSNKLWLDCFKIVEKKEEK